MERDLIDVFLREELRIANRHIPTRRVSICEVSEMEIPHVITQEGGIHVFDYREIVLLKSITSSDCKLKLPILIEFIPEGEGVYLVRDPTEARTVAQLLELKRWAVPLVLYRPEVFELRRKLRTTSTILLSPSTISKDV